MIAARQFSDLTDTHTRVRAKNARVHGGAMTTDPPAPTEIDPAAVERGVYDAFMTVLDATQGYTSTRGAFIDAIERGTQKAIAEYLRVHGLPEARH